MSHYQHLLDQLKQLRLGGLLDTLESAAQGGRKNDNWPTSTFTDSADSG